MYKKILVTLDGSPTSEAVLSEVAKLAAGSDAEVTLLTVVHAPGATSEAPQPMVASVAAPGGTIQPPGPHRFETKGQAIERVREDVINYLDEQSEALKKEGVTVKTHAAFGKPVDEILAHAKEIDTDVIIMATHGHTGVGQVIFGSVAARILGSGVKPVLLVRPEKLK